MRKAEVRHHNMKRHLSSVLIVAGLLLCSGSAHALTTLHIRPAPGSGEFASLQAAYEAMNVPDDYDVVVHEGLYNEANIGGSGGMWRTFFPGRRIRIMAAPGEDPLFDGNGGDQFMHVRITASVPIGLHIEGLHIRNYKQGIILEGWIKPDSCPRPEPDTWNGGVVIRNNIFERIGDVAVDYATCGSSYAAILLISSRQNVIEGNVFRDITNCNSAANQLHVIYANFESDGNLIVGNFIDNASGDPFKFRWGSSSNTVVRNHVHRAFYDGPGQQYRVDSPDGSREEKPVSDIRFVRNLILHPYEVESAAPDTRLFTCYLNQKATCKADINASHLEICLPSWFTADAYTSSRFAKNDPTSYDVTATTSADFDGDGQAELVVAIVSGGVSRVLRPKLLPYYMGEVIWSGVGESVVAMTSGDYNGDGRPDLLLAIRHGDGITRIWRGSGRAWTGGQDLGPIYAGATTSWGVSAMASGDYDGDGRDEVLTAFRHGTDKTSVYRGNGWSWNTGATSHGIVYTSTYFRIPAMVTGDVDGDGRDDAITAFSTAGEDRVYVGDGVTGLTNKKRIYTSVSKRVVALATGDVDGDGHVDLLSALRTANWQETTIWRGNGWNHYTSVPNGLQGQLVYTATSPWRVPALVVDDFRAGNADELATVFRHPHRMQIWNGDGDAGVWYWKFFDEAL